MVGLFTSLALAPLLGGTVHGYFPDETSIGYLVLWRSTLVALGAASFCFWAVGASISLPLRARRLVTAFATLGFLVYLPYVTVGNPSFQVAVIGYLPATFFLMGSLLYRYVKSKDKNVIPAIAGLVLTLVASALQQLNWDIDPIYLNHNTLYHLIEGIAFYLVFLTFRTLMEAGPPVIAPRLRKNDI
jgi:hypothetical protein